MSGRNNTILVEKLDAFIRRYYKNQLIRGAVYFTLAALISFFIIALLEYYGRYNSGVRAILFYSFILISGYFLIRYMLIPLAHMYSIGKVISHRQAAQIIGKHFPEVKDKLLNTLQLGNTVGTGEETPLLRAAIEQKTNELKPVPFSSAIDLRKNLRYARYVILPVLLYVLVYLVAPGMISDGGKRVIRYQEAFKPQAPFRFVIENKELKAEQFADFEMRLTLEGNQLPEEVYLVRGGNSIKMRKEDNTHFSYTFSSLRSTEKFLFEADEYSSETYELNVVAKPQLVGYQIKANYPAYLNKKSETLNNPGDFSVPAGTTLNWIFTAKQTNEILLGFNGTAVKAEQKETDVFSYSKKLFISTGYFIKTTNPLVNTGDSLRYDITVIPDAYPSISAEEKADSLTGKQIYFIGDASDDYGLTRLAFRYRFIKSDDKEKTKRGVVSRPLAVDKQSPSQRFYYEINLDEIGVQPSDEIEYFFEVWDNDGVHGSKSSRSKTMMKRSPSQKELEEKTEAGSGALKEKMEESIKESKQMQKDLKDLEKKMLEKRELTWEEKKKLDNLLERQKKLTDKIEEIKKEQKQLAEQEKEFKKQSEEILQKQQQVEKMFNEIMNEEMKKLIKQLEQMMQMQNKDLIKQEMEKMQLNNKDVEKELDRMLEQFKRLELEKKLEDATQKLDKIQQKQEELSKKSEELSGDKKTAKEEKQERLDEIKEEQKKTAEEFKELEKELKDIEQKNKELEDPKEMENTEEEQKETEQNMEEGEKEIEKKDPKKAAEKQKKAAESMKKMSEKMKSGAEKQEKKEIELNAEALREILENTIQLSKDQEKLMEEFKQINGYSPQFVEMAKEQKRVKDNARIIEDSLLALSKKVPEIRSFINREVTKLNDNLERSVSGFGKRYFGEIRTRQQYAMTHANNLAVMLSEVLKQMQDQMSGSSDKKDGKPKPKKGKGKGKQKGKSMGELKKMQEELNKQLREGLNKQQKEGGQKPGGQQGMGSQGFARMAAQQQAIRQQLQKLMQEMGAKEKEGMGGTKAGQEMQKLMEQTEKELFNKRLTTEMLQRQQEILTRLLESEKAERKQEQEQKREAEQAKEKPKATPPDFEQYIKQKNKEKELQQTIPAQLQPYYKEKAKEYFNKVGDN